MRSTAGNVSGGDGDWAPQVCEGLAPVTQACCSELGEQSGAAGCEQMQEDAGMWEQRNDAWVFAR